MFTIHNEVQYFFISPRNTLPQNFLLAKTPHLVMTETSLIIYPYELWKSIESKNTEMFGNHLLWWRNFRKLVTEQLYCPGCAEEASEGESELLLGYCLHHVFLGF